MGVFDYVSCKYPLPAGAPVDGYQTKDTDAQYLDNYEIREDGTLWWEDVTREVERGDHLPLGFCMRRVSAEWKQQVFTGEIVFYADDWEFSAYFVNGVIAHLHTLTSPACGTGADGAGE